MKLKHDYRIANFAYFYFINKYFEKKFSFNNV